jgi:mono/diheme cytochrome c family protein
MGLRLIAMMVLLVGVARAQSSPPDGGVLYRADCEGCHGAKGGGDGPDAGVCNPPPRDLRTGVLARYDADQLARSIREGTALPLGLDPEALRARLGDIEALVTYLQRLPKVDWELASQGRTMYIARCATCHGLFGTPTGVPPGIHPPRDLAAPAFQRAISDRDLLRAVQHGRRGMPAIPGLHDEHDAQALLASVRLLSPGFSRYTRFCGACHGPDGRGGVMVDPGQAPHVVFDAKYFKTSDPEQLRIDVWHMLGVARPAMPHFRARLSDAEVRAIVGYLKELR